MTDPEPNDAETLGWPFIIAISLVAWLVILAPALVLIMVRT